jgi:hypothetical protein
MSPSIQNNDSDDDYEKRRKTEFNIRDKLQKRLDKNSLLDEKQNNRVVNTLY